MIVLDECIMLDCKEIVFSSHAVQRMFERVIYKSDVINIIRVGEIIQNYPDDLPYPSYLVFGKLKSMPLHVVVGKDDSIRKCIIITVYIPSLNHWMEDYKTRKVL